MKAQEQFFQKNHTSACRTGAAGSEVRRSVSGEQYPRAPCSAGDDRPYYEGDFREMTLKEAIEYAGTLDAGTILEVILDEY